MTLPDAVRAFLGDGAFFDDPTTPDRENPLDILSDADLRAGDVLRMYGVLYSDGETGEGSAETVIAELARAYSGPYDVDRVIEAVKAAGQVSAGLEHVSDVVKWYAWPHMRAAYYLGLAIRWRVAQQFGGGR